jgi:hypothetical protein
MGVQINSYGKNVLDYWDTVVMELTETGTRTITIPARSHVREVVAEVLTASDATTSALLTIGDGDNADGYLLSCSAKATAGTRYGDDSVEWGSYMPGGRWYPDEDTLDCLLTVTGDATTGKLRIWAHIVKFYDE